MRRNNTSISKSKSRSVTRCASVGLIDYLKQKYDRGIPISAVTAAHKLYGRSKPLAKEDRFIKRFSTGRNEVDTNKLIDYLGKPEIQERGKGLNEDAMKRVYGNCSNQDGKLTFEYLMKMGDSCGVTINEKMAKAMVRKYGKRKDHLNL